jgi:hypothetical protein
MSLDKQTLLDDALLLVEQNFYFLHAGAFYSQISRAANLSHHFDTTVTKQFEDGTIYSFTPSIIQEILNDAPLVPTGETTLFEYFVEFNAFRGICMAMVEALRLESDFRDFLQERLGDRFEDFIDILSFIRNVLSHNIHAEIALNPKDYEGTLGRILRMRRDPDMTLDFNYSRDLPELCVPDRSYGFTCHVDFSTMQSGMSFLDILSLRELFLMSEWCFNLVVGYRLYAAD